MHPALVQPLNLVRSSSKLCASFHSRTYSALQYVEHFAGPYQSGGLSAPTQGLHFWVNLPHSFHFLCTLLWYNHCTVQEAAPKCTQICIHGHIRHCSTWSIWRAGTGRCVFCTNSRFTFLGSPSPYHPFHMHLVLVQPLYRGRSTSQLCANFNSRTYTALP